MPRASTIRAVAGDPAGAGDNTTVPPGADASPEVGGERERVVVCGLQELSLSIVEQLRAAGVDVVVVDDRADRRLLAVLHAWGVAVVDGSPRSPTILAEAGADTARAVICVAENDLQTLEVALVAHGLRPGMRVVVQMTNAAVARALQTVTGPGSALDVADLAAPSIVQACLRDSRHELTLAGERFTALELRVERPGTLRELFGDLVPIAVVPAGTTEVDVCPGRDRTVEAGDRVTLLGEPELLPVQPGGDESAETRWSQVAPTIGHGALAAWRWTDRGFRVALGLLVLLVAVSSVVIHFAYRPPTGGSLSLLTSLYFTVETVATVGFGDFSFAGQSAWLRVFGIVLIILGASLVTTMFALLTNLLVSRAVAQVLGRSRAVRMRRHVVVVGLGSIGLRVVEKLHAAQTGVVVIERDAENRHLAQARALKIPIIVGDATQPATLEQANVRRASAVAVLTSDDLTNLETALSLHDYLGVASLETPVILRVFDPAFARTVERNFGLRHVHSTSALAAPWFVGAALGLDILLTFPVERERLLVARLVVASTGGLAGLAMRDLSARIRVVAIRRAAGGSLEHPPRRDTRFSPGDEAYLIGPHEELLRVLRRDAVAPAGAPAGA